MAPTTTKLVTSSYLKQSGQGKLTQPLLQSMDMFENYLNKLDNNNKK